MKYYIQFYHYGVVSGELIEACGTDSVSILDGRWSLWKMDEVAKERGDSHFRRHPAYQIMKAHNGRFSGSTPVGSLRRTKWAK